MKTIMLEDLPLETQEVVAGWLLEKAPVMILRDGQFYGELNYLGPDDDALLEITPEEEKEILEDLKQGEAELAAGDCISLDDFKIKYADRLRGAV